MHKLPWSPFRSVLPTLPSGEGEAGGVDLRGRSDCADILTRNHSAKHNKVLTPIPWIIIAVLAVVLGACGGGEQVSEPTPAATTVPVSTPTSTPTLTPTPASQSALPETLFLEIKEPANESIVNDTPLVVVGITVPDAVVSVDGQTAEVNARGQFVVLVSLEGGPNLIEVVASDLAGVQESVLLAVIYSP